MEREGSGIRFLKFMETDLWAPILYMTHDKSDLGFFYGDLKILWVWKGLGHDRKKIKHMIWASHID